MLSKTNNERITSNNNNNSIITNYHVFREKETEYFPISSVIFFDLNSFGRLLLKDARNKAVHISPVAVLILPCVTLTSSFTSTTVVTFSEEDIVINH